MLLYPEKSLLDDSSFPFVVLKFFIVIVVLPHFRKKNRAKIIFISVLCAFFLQKNNNRYLQCKTKLGNAYKKASVLDFQHFTITVQESK